MFRFHCRSLPTAASTATNAILLSTFRNLTVVHRRGNQNNNNKRTAATHQQLSKPKDDNTTGTGEHISPSSSSTSSSSQAPTTFVIREKQLPPIITMPTADQINNTNNLKNQFGKSYNENNNNVIINHRPLEKLFMIINDRIFEQEMFEQRQQQLQTQQNDQEIINTTPVDDNVDAQEQKLELLRRQQEKQQQEAMRTSKMSNDQKAVFLNRHSSTNFSAFATTAEEIIKEFRSTFKIPNVNSDKTSQTSHGRGDDKILSLPDSSLQQQQQQNQQPQHLPKKKKMSTSIHNNNSNDLILLRQKQQQQSTESTTEGNNNTSASSPLANYCGAPEDVLQLAMIVMQSCVDVSEIATARLLFALVVREVPFDVIPTQFFRLYFLALSRSDTTTLEEFNGLVQLIGGRAAVKQNTVIALCVLEVKLRMGFNVTLGEVEEALMTNPSKSTSDDDEKNAASFKNGNNKINGNNNNNNDVATPSSFMMSEESETRLKLRDCFLVAVKSHPDPNIATLLLREWTKLSDLSEFVGETNTIVHFLLVASNNSAATPALCAELISLLDGLSSSQQHKNNNSSTTDNSQQQSSSPSLTSLVTLKTLIKTAARAIRVEDWKSFLTIEKFTRNLFLTSVSSKLEEKKNDNNNNNQDSNATTTTSSPEVQAIISSTLSIFKILALIETNQPEKILSPSLQQPSLDEMNRQNKTLALTMQLCPQLFNFNKKEDLDSNICPFFLDKLMTKTSNKTSSLFATTKLISQKRFELASLINFPISEFPPMTLLLESLIKNSDTCAIFLNSKNAAQSAIQGFTETLILLTAATFERANDIISKQKHVSSLTSSSNNNSGSSRINSSSVEVIEILKMYFSRQFNISKNPSMSIFAAPPVDSTTLIKNNNETSSRNPQEGSEGGPYHQHLNEILHLHKSHLIILNSALTFLKLVAGALGEVQQAQRENIETMMLFQEAEENLAAEVQLLVSYLVDEVLTNERFFEREAEVRGLEIFGGDEIGSEVARMKRDFLLEMSRVLRRNHLKSTCEELEKLAAKIL